jgi:tetratricopeptide (TPR) repeat protein
MATCFERLGEIESAVHAFTKATAAAPNPALAYRRRIIELNDYPLRVEDEKLAALLDAYMADTEDQPSELMWALNRRIDMLLHHDEVAAAEELVAKYHDLLAESTESAGYAYLLASLDYGAGRYDDAERRLRLLLNEIERRNPVYGRAGWLLGRVVLGDGRAQRPEEAIAIFREVITSRGDRAYVAASRLGMAESLAAVERYEESRQAYREAINDLRRVQQDRNVNPEAIRLSLTSVAEAVRRDGRLARAAEFYEMALALVPKDSAQLEATHRQLLADTLTALAREMLSSGAHEGAGEHAVGADAEARRLLGEAGDHYMQISRLVVREEIRSADAVWTAANLYDEGEHRDRLVTLLQDFVRDRRDAELMPRVLLRLGRALQAAGRYPDAIETFRREVTMYPRSPLAQQALIPLAECFMDQGGAADAEAERALKQVIDNSDLFTPDAPEYRDAMFLLGELYCRQARYEEALPVLEESLANYPDDIRAGQAMFRAANAFRQSAMAIKEDLKKPEFVGEAKSMHAAMNQRLQEAARRFRTLTEHLEARTDDELTDVERMYLQDARLYEAACLFEQQRYSDALALYERAAWVYKDSPVALGAYVQVINCYVFLGRQEEAETALRRAQYLVETIDEERFLTEGGTETRDHWRKYFTWVADVIKDSATG